MKYVAILILPLLTSCLTPKQCLQRFQPDTVRIVTIFDTTIFSDTTITVFLPGDTVLRTDSVVIPCPPPVNYIPDTALAESSYSIAQAWFDHPAIRLTLQDKDLTFIFRLDSAIREATHWRNEYEKITAIQEVRKIPVIYKIALWAWGGVLVLIIFLFIIYLLFKK